MPYKSIEEANDAIKGIKPPVTLEQANLTASWADEIGKDDDAPEEPWGVAIAKFKRAYEVQDGEWIQREEKAADAFEYHVLSFALGDGAAAAEEDDLVWKEVLHPGKWYKTDSGKEVEVTEHIVEEAVRAFNAGLPKYVSVPADSHHIATRGVVPAEHNRGFVKKLKKIGKSLFAGFKFTDPAVAANVRSGGIADCSVYLQPGVKHPATGQEFGWVLRHVLLTNNPLVQDLRGWGDIPAAAEDQSPAQGPVYVVYRQAADADETGAAFSTHTEGDMPEKNVEQGAVIAGADEIILSGEARDEYVELAGLGLTVEDIKALAAQRDALDKAARDVRGQQRSLRVTQVVRALEGAEDMPGVTQIQGYRHYPVVVQAVERALTEGVSDVMLDADEEGACDLDRFILDVVNSIPAEGRIATAEQSAGRKTDDNGDGDEVTEEEIDAFLDDIGA